MKPAMLGMGNFKQFSPTTLVAEASNTSTHEFHVPERVESTHNSPTCVAAGFHLPPFHLLHGEDDTVRRKGVR
jgi:hypothetical protein